MIAGLNFNIQMIYSSKKGRVKGRVLIDLYCNVVKFEISRIALNQGFYRLVTCNESLFHLSEDKVQGDKVVKESISISFINRLGIFIGVVGAIIRYW